MVRAQNEHTLRAPLAAHMAAGVIIAIWLLAAVATAPLVIQLVGKRT